MPMFRKKPVQIEARRVPTYPQPRGRETSIVAYVDECVALAEWCGGRSHMMNDADSGIEDHILIPTLEGDMRALPGDWIIRGVAGEFYPCKPDVFTATYERVQPSPAATEAIDPACSPLRDLIAAAIYERNNPAHQWANAHPDDRLAYGFDADAVLAVILPATRATATLARMSEADVQRVIDLYERWIKAGPPPLGTSMSRWWDKRLAELHDAILPPTDQTKES